MNDLVPSNPWHLLNRDPSKKEVKEYTDSQLMKSLYDYDILPKEELNDKLRFYYSPYNVEYKFHKCIDFENVHNES